MADFTITRVSALDGGRSRRALLFTQAAALRLGDVRGGVFKKSNYLLHRLAVTIGLPIFTIFVGVLGAGAFWLYAGSCECGKKKGKGQEQEAGTVTGRRRPR